MRAICLTLPTNRACPDTLVALAAEAAWAVRHFDVHVRLLVLDSCPPPQFARHAEVLAGLPADPRITVHHLDEAAQRDFLARSVERAGLLKPELLQELMLPAALSYGACTNRAFLIGAALGCESVHRRDSDSRYQQLAGEPVYPVHHELTALGRPAREVAPLVSEAALAPEHQERAVALVGGSFIGELSVDIGEIQRLDPDVYTEVVGLWAPGHWPAERKRELVAESFRGSGSAPFTRDRSTLTLVDPMRVDMCNVAFHGVHTRVPLPPATDTIGSDYFLLHLVRHAGLPGVLHNRDIENYYTGERRTHEGFLAYQLRYAKFLLSMRYLHHVYEALEAAGPALLDAAGQVDPAAVAALVEESTGLDQAENVARLDTLEAAHRTLGGRYTEVAALLAGRRERLLDEAGRDMEDFALLIRAWGPWVAAAAETPVGRPAGSVV